MDVKEITCEDEELTFPYRTGTSDDQSYEHDNEPSGSMNIGEFLDWLRDYELLTKEWSWLYK
jgi:hypothetical protein